MANFGTPVVTAKGNALQAKVTAGRCNFAFTKMCTSNVIASRTVTSLSSIKQTSVIASVKVVNDTNVKISTAFDNAKLTEGYYVHTIGLYAMDPDEGEILYSFVTTETVDYMPSFNGIDTSSLLLTILIDVSNSENVNLTVTPAAYATVTQITDLQKQVNDIKGYVGYGYENIWGVEVDYKNNKITRIGAAEDLKPGADFDNLKPWQRRKCLVAEEGKVVCYLGDEGYREDGCFKGWAATNVMVEQPIFYTKVVPLFYEDAASGVGKQVVKCRYYISDTPLEGFKANEVFKDANGNWQDKIYLAAYEGALRESNEQTVVEVSDDVTDINWNDLTYRLASAAGVKPVSGVKLNLTLPNARKLADKVNGAGVRGWCLHNIFALSVTQILMLVEYASFDCQTVIGKGICQLTDNNSANMAMPTGATYSLINLGNTSGSACGSQPDDGQFAVTYRGEENLWGNILTWLDGINIEADGNNNIYVNSNITNMASGSTDNYNKINYQLSHQTGFISAFGYDSEYDYLFLPTAATGTSVHPIGAYCYENTAATGIYCAQLGGCHWDNTKCSAWYIDVRRSNVSRSRNMGCRLLYIPQSVSSAQEG